MFHRGGVKQGFRGIAWKGSNFQDILDILGLYDILKRIFEYNIRTKSNKEFVLPFHFFPYKMYVVTYMGAPGLNHNLRCCETSELRPKLTDINGTKDVLVNIFKCYNTTEIEIIVSDIQCSMKSSSN